MDVIKFLCKDLWTLLFRKQIDNLKTNHRVHRLMNVTDYRVYMFLQIIIFDGVHECLLWQELKMLLIKPNL